MKSIVEKPEDVPYFFVLIADPQIGFPYPKYDCEKCFSEAVEKINDLTPQPKFVACLGDMIHLEFPKEKMLSEEECEKVFEKYNRIKKKLSTENYYVVAGNHDIGDYPTKETYQFYQKMFGKPYYSFEVEKDLFIVLESNVFQHCSKEMQSIQDDQLEWLRKTIEGSKGYRNVSILMHHPLGLKSEKVTVLNCDYFRLPKESVDKLKREFSKCDNLEYIFCGHYHQLHEMEIPLEKRKVKNVTVSSVGLPLAQWMDKPTGPGFTLGRVSPKGIHFKYLLTKDVPKSFFEVNFD